MQTRTTVDVVYTTIVIAFAFLVGDSFSFQISSSFPSSLHRNHNGNSNGLTLYGNIYDEWKSDMPVDSMPLDEELVNLCLEEIIYSDFGKQMFGVHDRAGITGEISLVEIAGPEIFLQLNGKFWHSRSYVLGIAAVYLNARIPEITRVSVLDPDELNDFEEVQDEFTGDIIEVIDRRAPDFNGDRETMIYQGIDPNQRGPFPGNTGEFKIIPA